MFLFMLTAREGRVSANRFALRLRVSDVPPSRRRRICVSRVACRRTFLAPKPAILRVFYIGTNNLLAKPVDAEDLAEEIQVVSGSVMNQRLPKVKEFGSEREFVTLPNWRALGLAAASATDTEASARSVARWSC